MRSPITRTAVKTFRAAEQTERTVRGTQLAWIDVGVLWAIYLVVIIAAPARSVYFNVSQNFSRIQTSPLAKFVGIDSRTQPLESKSIELEKSKPMKEGEIIGGFSVSSERGWRNIGAGQEYHEGVDLATPINTALYAPAAILLTCNTDQGGGGLVAAFDLDEVTHKFLHLSDCVPGNYAQGEKFASTGNSGRSTGAHVDYRAKNLNGRGKWIEPNRGLLTAVMSGGNLVEPKDQDNFTERYKKAIVAKESGGDSGAVNLDSAAMGKYQFMPDTAQAMNEICNLGWSGQAADFLADADLQSRAMDCYIENSNIDDPNEFKRCRRLAAYHYAGDDQLFDDARPQSYGGNSYPSISDYTAQVCTDF